MCLLLLWEKTATLFNLKKALHAFGTMTIVLLTRQFLTSAPEDHKLVSRTNTKSNQLLNPAVSAFIYWPFFIGFILKFCVFICFLILSLIPTPTGILTTVTKSRTQTKNMSISKYSTRNQGINNYFLVLVLLFTSSFFIGACQSGFTQYTFSVAVKLNIGFNQKDAALLNIVVSAVSFVSLLVACLATYYIPVRIVTLTLAFSAILPDILLIFLGLQSSKMFWIFATFKAFLLMPNSPLAVPFIDSYTEMAGGMVVMHEIIYSSGSIIQYFINGYLLEYQTPWTLLVFGLIITVALCMTQFGAFLAAGTGCKKERNKYNMNEEEDKLIEQ